MGKNHLIRTKDPTKQKTLLISLLKVMFLVLIAITVFEYAKYLIFPRLTVFYSHIIGIIFGVMIIGATAYRVQKKQEQLTIEKIAETARRLQSEASLLDVEEKYHKLFIDSMDGVCQTTLDGKIVEANQAFCDILGDDAEGIIGVSITQFYADPEDRIEFRSVIEKNKGVQNYEIILKRKDGRQIICSVSSSCYYSKNEELGGYLSIVRDITEHKLAEEALQEREEKYCNLFNNAEVGMFRTRLDGSEILDMNEKFLEIFGLTREEMQGNPSVMHWADPQEREEMVGRLKTEVRISGFECRMINKRGEERNCLTSLRAYPEQGILEGSIIDITDRKRAEEALRESEDRYRRIVETSLEGIWILNEERRTIFVNKRIADMLGFDPEEMLGKRVDSFMFEEDIEDYAIRGDVRRRNVADVFERRFRRKDGTTIWSIVSSSPLFDGEGRFTGRFAMFTDITTRKQAEEEILALSILDQLTGLHNRRGFLSLAGQQLKLAERDKRRMLLFFADLDGLKWINDTLGHEEGDEALIEAATVLRETFRTSDIIARLGGDEYAALMVDVTEANSEILTARLQALIETRNNQENRRYKLSISVGCSYYDPENPCSLDELMASADKLMYEQKQNKKGLLLQGASLSNGIH